MPKKEEINNQTNKKSNFTNMEVIFVSSSSLSFLQRSSRYHNYRHNQRSQSLNRGQTLSQADVTGMWWHRGASGKLELIYTLCISCDPNWLLFCSDVPLRFIKAAQSSGCASCAMGNKLSCSCAPLMRKGGYRYEDSPWQSSRRRDGHLLR